MPTIDEMVASAGPREREIPLPNGLKIWFRDLGSGPALFLLHGGTRTSANWVVRMPTLATRFRVIAVDSRGHGHTINTSDRLTYPMMADDIRALMDQLELERAFFYGFSDGANIALDLAIRHPDVVAGLALGGLVFRLFEGYLEGLRHFFGGEIVTDADLDRFARQQPAFVADLVSLHSAQGEEHWRRLLPVIFRLFGDPFDGAVGYSDEQIAGITRPTLVLTGDRDALIPLEHTIALFRLLPNARLRVEPGLGHGTHESWTQLVSDFFAEHVLTIGTPPG